MVKRIEWVDCVHGLGIFLVVLGHLNTTEIVDRYIYSFHMPLLFVLSGYLFSQQKRASIGSYIGKKAREKWGNKYPADITVVKSNHP